MNNSIENKNYLLSAMLLAISVIPSLLFAADPVRTSHLVVENNFPQVSFKVLGTSGYDWRLLGHDDKFAITNFQSDREILYFQDDSDMQLEITQTAFQIEDELSNTIMNVHRDAPFSLDIRADGDVKIAGGAVFIDTSSNFVGIGTDAPAAEIHISSTFPRMDFDDSASAGREWRLHGDRSSFGLHNYETGKYIFWFDDLADMQVEMDAQSFQIEDEIGNDIVRVHRNAPLSLDILSTGDLSLADGDVFIDTSANYVGIGTTIPREDLHIASTTPGIRLDDTSISHADWYMGNNGNNLVFQVGANNTGGPTNHRFMSLGAQTGLVGVHQNSPTAALHVGSHDKESAKVLVENTTTTVAPRTLFELKNPGNTKFTVNNTDAAVQWAFANPGTGFRLSRQGSGFVEFEILNNGDAILQGALTENSDVNSKLGIEAINTAEILEKVVAMPISQWRYKDAPDTKHLGPMAQDFHAAFGLGNTDKGISTLDSSGVALAAIQALAENNEILVDQNRELTEKNRSLEQRVHALEQQNQRIEDLVLGMISAQTEKVAVN